MATSSNTPRNVGRRGQRLGKLQVAIEAVKDRATREAIEALVDHVEEQRAKGVTTDGPVVGASFESSNGGKIKFMEFSFTLLPEDNVGNTDRQKIVVPGKILGAIGWSQLQGLEVWNPMEINVPIGNSCYLMYSSATNTERVLHVRNNDGSNSNKCRGIVFYQDDNQ